MADEAQLEAPCDEGDPDDGTETETKTLNQIRLQTVCAAVIKSGAKSVLDLGCGEGRFLAEAKTVSQFEKLTGVDASLWSLRRARRVKRKDDTDKITFLASSFVYQDARLKGHDAAVCVEVIEHVEPFWLPTFEQNVFGFLGCKTVVVTTPNREYNVLWENVGTDKFRHRDHRFEWTRDEFNAWASRVAQEHGYAVEFSGIGEAHPEHGTPTQMAVFSKEQAK